MVIDNLYSLKIALKLHILYILGMLCMVGKLRLKFSKLWENPFRFTNYVIFQYKKSL